MVRRATAPALPEDFDIHVIARPERQLRRQEVEVITGLSASSIYRLLGTGDFPRPLRITRAASVGSNPKSPTGRPTRPEPVPQPWGTDGGIEQKSILRTHVILRVFGKCQTVTSSANKPYQLI
jgi:prophage regulatory protein